MEQVYGIDGDGGPIGSSLAVGKCDALGSSLSCAERHEYEARLGSDRRDTLSHF